ncbi:MAG: holo-ACP synthase [Thermodesulfobacteriota bacterium]
MILGIGVDLVEVARMERALGRFGQRLVQRLFHPSEAGYCEGKKDRAECLSATFAAKEAFLKALGTGLALGISWLDIQVVRGANRAPELRLGGKAATILKEMGGRRCLVSISHQGGYGLAAAVIEGGPPEEPKRKGV